MARLHDIFWDLCWECEIMIGTAVIVARIGYNTGILSKISLKIKTQNIWYACNINLYCPTVSKFCTEHGSVTAVLCAKFSNLWTIKNVFIGKQNILRFELMSRFRVGCPGVLGGASNMSGPFRQGLAWSWPILSTRVCLMNSIHVILALGTIRPTKLVWVMH